MPTDKSSGEPRQSDRRRFLKSGLTVAAASLAAPGMVRARTEAMPGQGSAASVRPFELDEVSLADISAGLQAGKYTSRGLVEKYLARIAEIDTNGPALNAVIELNPDALADADALDAERKSKGPRGALHGVPILIKDNIGTADRMTTTAGSLALLGFTSRKDSGVARQLRDAGALLLGKTNLSEWANFRSSHSSSGWSGRGGQTHNPYAFDRSPCGSSSGSGAAVAASLCSAAVGSETDGSIVCPSSANGIVGIKPTVGLVSRAGIIPISHTQDTAGPMARSVTDAAILLSGLAGVDANDPATKATGRKAAPDYTKFLDRGGLKGVRIGVIRKTYDFSESVAGVLESALDAMKHEGAVLIDPAEIASLGKFDDSEQDAMLYEFKHDLNAYLAAAALRAPVRTLKELIAYNEKFADRELEYFGQDLFVKAEKKGPLTEKKYLDALAKNHLLTREQGIDGVMAKYELDALVAPTAGPTWLIDLVDGDHDTGGTSSLAAVAGYPNINVPMGFVRGLPVGISFFGRAWSEPVLIKIVYAFEQATKHRKPPRFLPTADFTMNS